MTTSIIRMVGSMVCKYNDTCVMCVTKRFKSLKIKDFKAIRQFNYENTKCFGPVIKQKKDTNDEHIKEEKTDEKSKKKKSKNTKDTASHLKNKVSSENTGMDTDLKEKENSKINETEKDTVTKEKSNSEDKVLGHSESSINDDSRPHKKQEDTKFSFILTCPILRCEDDIDNSILIQSSGSFVPSVTHIIGETQSDLSKFYLERWKKSMISEMGEEGFKAYQEVTFRNGSNLHANIQNYLSGTPESALDIYKDNMGHWESIHKVLEEVQDAVAMEEFVIHQHLRYKGKFDCVAVYRDKLCVIDWKTSKKNKPTLKDTFDNPLQVAAYIGAINNSDLLRSKGMDQIRSGAIVIAYSDGHPAHVHVMDQKLCEQYWKKWLERLHMYWQKIKSAK